MKSNLIIEKFQFENLLFLPYELRVPSNYLIYFEREQNLGLNKYIVDNLDLIRARIKSIDKIFIYMPSIGGDTKNLKTILEFYFPQLALNELGDNIIKIHKELRLKQITIEASDLIAEALSLNNFAPTPYDYCKLISLIGYSGSVSNGFIFFNGENQYVLSCSGQLNPNYDLLFQDLVAFIDSIKPDMSHLSICPPSIDYSEQLDEESKKIVYEIEENLINLKESGQLLLLIPVLKQVIEEQVKRINLSDISRIEINVQNRIWLPYFKKEVEMSYLTKSIYFLFLKHPEGINLKDLGDNRKELLTIYTSVSNQLDYEKMMKSVEDVCNLDTNAIYAHLSRIKSAYYKLMDKSYAKHYIISGFGEENRKVLISKNGIDWENPNPIDVYDL